MTHTPGPWWLEWLEGSRAFAIRSNENAIGYTKQQTTKAEQFRRDEHEANARLIAAAPELLEALEKFRDYVSSSPFGEGFSHHDPIWAKVAEVIAKARGTA